MVYRVLRNSHAGPVVTGGGSDRLIDDLVVHGTPEAVVAGLSAPFAAGADHAAVQVLPAPGQGPMPGATGPGPARYAATSATLTCSGW